MSQMNYEHRKAVYAAACKKWGLAAQSVVAIEELSELAKEVCKALRGQADINHMAEEVADVTIMLEQLRMMYDLGPAVERHMDSKIMRLVSRIAEQVGADE